MVGVNYQYYRIDGQKAIGYQARDDVLEEAVAFANGTSSNMIVQGYFSLMIGKDVSNLPCDSHVGICLLRIE